mmetsp:Transcript_31410/g.64713  ORF Transcript_31410/g.64713 Transcript_31410/m.64713 type:complete len:337 (-) Transcript_31410:739-1749(-)
MTRRAPMGVIGLGGAGSGGGIQRQTGQETAGVSDGANERSDGRNRAHARLMLWPPRRDGPLRGLGHREIDQLPGAADHAFQESDAVEGQIDCREEMVVVVVFVVVLEIAILLRFRGAARRRFELAGQRHRSGHFHGFHAIADSNVKRGAKSKSDGCQVAVVFVVVSPRLFPLLAVAVESRRRRIGRRHPFEAGHDRAHFEGTISRGLGAAGLPTALHQLLHAPEEIGQDGLGGDGGGVRSGVEGNGHFEHRRPFAVTGAVVAISNAATALLPALAIAPGPSPQNQRTARNRRGGRSQGIPPEGRRRRRPSHGEEPAPFLVGGADHRLGSAGVAGRG